MGKKKVLYIVVIVLISSLTVLMSGCIPVGTRLTINGVQGYIDAIQNTGPDVFMEIYPSGSFKLSSAYAVCYRDNTLEVLYCWIGKESTYRSHVWIEKLEDRDRFLGESTLPIGEFALVGSEEKPIQNVTCGNFFGASTIIWTNRWTKASSDPLYYQIAGRKFVPGNPNPTKPQPAPAKLEIPMFSKIIGNTIFFEEGESLTLFGKNLKQYLMLSKSTLGNLCSQWGNIKN